MKTHLSLSWFGSPAEPLATVRYTGSFPEVVEVINGSAPSGHTGISAGVRGFLRRRGTPSFRPLKEKQTATWRVE